MVLSTEPEKSRPLWMARQVTLLSCLISVCAHVICSMFHTCSGGKEDRERMVEVSNWLFSWIITIIRQLITTCRVKCYITSTLLLLHVCTLNKCPAASDNNIRDTFDIDDWSIDWPTLHQAQSEWNILLDSLLVSCHSRHWIFLSRQEWVLRELVESRWSPRDPLAQPLVLDSQHPRPV